MRSVLITAGEWAARTAAVGLLAGAGLVMAGAPASAHGQLAVSTPVKDSTVSQPLGKLELVFTEQPAANAHFAITAPSGVRVDAGWSNGEPQRLDKPVQELLLVNGNWEPRVYNTGFPAMLTVAHWPEKGIYTATYLSVASDGEPVRGTLTFTYNGPSTTAPGGWAPPTDEPSAALLQAVNGADPAPGQQTTSAPAAGPGNAANTPAKPATGGSSLTTWILPGLLVVTVAVVVIHAARKRAAVKPAARRNRAAGRTRRNRASAKRR
jgi:methionine-rich copper-binding protein CopC